MSKTIGILTSGGDCGGLNAVLKAVTYRAIIGYGWKVIGIRNSTMGLLQDPINYCNLTVDMFDNAIYRLGGTILGTTNQGNPFSPKNQSNNDPFNKVMESCKKLNIDAFIGVGGDGSMAILSKLFAKINMPFVGIPKTIDNDLGCTERAIGFSTAVEIATEALDRLQPTAASHNRVMILEVMGRDAGHIALLAGIAGNADIIIIPEIQYNMEKIIKHIKSLFQRGRNFALIIIAEAVKTMEGKHCNLIDPNTTRDRFGGISHYFATHIAKTTKAETRFTVLGHVQRGASPVAEDRVLASAFGVHAVNLIAAEKYSRMTVWQNREVKDVSIEEAIREYRAVDPNDDLVKTARGINISFGD